MSVPSRIGTTARSEGPSVPVALSVNAVPRWAGAIVPMKRPPILLGSGCE